MMNDTRKCSFCGCESLKRLRRKKWMKIIPFSELYKCHNCSGKYLLVASIFKIITNKGYSKFANVLPQNQ